LPFTSTATHGSNWLLVATSLAMTGVENVAPPSVDDER
jgi:hypothetical protein